MSDEPTTGRPAPPVTTADPVKPADMWGQPISAERKAEMQGYLDRWQAETDHGDRIGPFDGTLRDGGLRLTGADVAWLAMQCERDVDGCLPNLHLERANLVKARLQRVNLSRAHMEGAYLDLAELDHADLHEAHLEGASLVDAHLQRAGLIRAHLEEANLSGTHMEEADLREAWLSGAYLREASITGAYLNGAHLGGANFVDAHMEGATLGAAHLAGADLRGAHLEGAKLREAHLEGANFLGANLAGADLRDAWLDSKTVLSDATLDSMTHLGDIQWSGVGAVNLTQIDWHEVLRLGDEHGVGIQSSFPDHDAAVRAYRQLAAQLRAQGLSEVADRFAERAQIRERTRRLHRLIADWRRPWRLPRHLASWLFSWFLALLAGYGYHPGRSVFWYLATIAGFAALYMRFGVVYGHAFNPLEAAVFSLTSFHGRGFFPGGLTLDDPVTVLAAIEAVIGLLIEISFIATFTQRFFNSK